MAFFFGFVSIGGVAGVLIAEIQRDVILIKLEYITIILIFAFVFVMFTLIQLRETVPPKKELEWKYSIIQFFFNSSSAGICISDYYFKGKSEIDTQLFAGEPPVSQL